MIFTEHLTHPAAFNWPGMVGVLGSVRTRCITVNHTFILHEILNKSAVLFLTCVKRVFVYELLTG